MAVQADVADEAQVLEMFAQVDRQLGRLTALVNNAGIVDRTARVEEMSVDRLRRMFDINVIGSIVCAREAIKRMSTRHGGRGGAIVNVSSAAARLGAPGQYVDYAASKGAIDAFTIGLAKEVAAEGIRVNAVRPGLIETDIHASGGLPNRVRELQPTRSPCSAAAAPRRWPRPSSGCCRRRRATPPCRWWTFREAADGDHAVLGRPAARQRARTRTTSVSAEEIKEFAGRYDPQPFHLDEEAGRRSMFGGLCASGWQTCALAMRLTVDNMLKDSSSRARPGWRASNG